MARKRKLYELTEEDIEVFRAGTFNANAFTDYYFRTPRTGTDYAPSHSRYPEIDAAWKAAGEPYDLWEFEGEEWSAVWGADELPFFRHHHGLRFIPWQLGIHHCTQKLRAVAGGFSCLDIDARIYEADLQKYVTVRWLQENMHSPTVLAKTTRGWIKTPACLPFLKGREDFLRLTTTNGNVIEVSLYHRLLTPRGWQRAIHLEPGSELIASGEFSEYKTVIDVVQSVKHIGQRDAYDLHVPVLNNYVAEGLVHHNSGKSLGMVVGKLVLAATVEEFKAMLTAPSFFQAKVLYQMAVDIMTNTVFEERFLLSAVSAPFPIITIGNSHVGESTLEFKSVSDDGESILSWRGDVAVVDQAELIPDIKQLRKNLGSRLVGKARCGRHHMGIMEWVANAGPSPRFWALYDLGKTQPEKAIAITVTSYDNPHNSEEDLRWLEEEVGGTQEAIDQWMLAKKPIVDGEYFSNDTLAKCRAKELEKLMADGLKEERMGFVFEEDGTGIYKWFTPYEHGRSYLVVGDPGQANRPDRNSPVIGVFDITEWPTFAYLRGFHWMDGRASITPFLAEFQLLVEKYHAHGQCAFDSTGTQTTLDELAFDFNDLMVEGMNFGQLKMIMLNALRILMEHGKMRYPYIGGIWDQLGNYKLPDKKLRQDIVSMLMMAAHWLRMNMQEDHGAKEDEEDAIPVTRDDYALADRYASLAR